MKLASNVVAVARFSLLGALALAACGGGGAAAGGDTTAGEPGGPASDDDGAVVSAETMDEIRRALDRKRNVVARCLTPAIEAEELPKSSRGRMTLSFVISPQGRAGEIEVVKTSLESKLLASCVIERVGEIEFPELPKPLPWSYTYGFEAM
jgi:hypothetical protein